MKLKIQRILGLFLLFLVILSLNLFAGNTQSAGRIYHIGENFSEAIKTTLNDNLPQNIKSDWKVGIIVFTKPDHTFSNRAVAELLKINETVDKNKTFPIWEICTKETNHKTDLPGSWIQLIDTDYEYYNVMGPRVYPTLFIIDSELKIINYLAGFSPSAPKTIRESLAEYYPDEFQTKTFVKISKEDKKLQRKEHLGLELYNKKMYPMALMQLKGIEHPSVEAKILMAKIHIHLENYSEAELLLVELLNSGEKPDYARLYLAVVKYESGNYEEALNFLNNIRTIPHMYKIHYWKAKSYEKLDNQTMALKEYKKTVRQILKNLDDSDTF